MHSAREPRLRAGLYPTPTSARMYLGLPGFSSAFLPMLAMLTRSVWLSLKYSPHISLMIKSCVSTLPAFFASSARILRASDEFSPRPEIPRGGCSRFPDPQERIFLFRPPPRQCFRGCGAAPCGTILAETDKSLDFLNEAWDIEFETNRVRDHK